MIEVIEANKRHFVDHGWLQTYWLFSFSDYYDPANVQFGALRVFNDDVIKPGMGFPMHHHEEMEIVTIVLEGEVTHRDSVGNEAVTKAGEVQRMSAGAGIDHSELNKTDAPLHLYQIWIYPNVRGLVPGYKQKRFSPSEWKNRLLAVASGQHIAGAVTMHTDSTIYRADFDAAQKAEFKAAKGRGVFIYITSGHLMVNDARLTAGDQARITKETSLTLRAEKRTEFILIDVPYYQ